MLSSAIFSITYQSRTLIEVVVYDLSIKQDTKQNLKPKDQLVGYELYFTLYKKLKPCFMVPATDVRAGDGR